MGLWRSCLEVIKASFITFTMVKPGRDASRMRMRTHCQWKMQNISQGRGIDHHPQLPDPSFSPPSKSSEPRPLLLNCYTSADAKPYTPHPDPSSHAFELVRGNPVRWAEHDPRPCLIPPDWSGGYSSIFAAQVGEDS